MFRVFNRNIISLKAIMAVLGGFFTPRSPRNKSSFLSILALDFGGQNRTGIGSNYIAFTLVKRPQGGNYDQKGNHLI